mgnify:CR=1 FL=1
MLETEHTFLSDAPTASAGGHDSAGSDLVASIVGRCRDTRALIGRCEPLEVHVVHQSRKNLKKIRAGIKLLSDADGLDLVEANRLCRDVGRLLSELRDTDVCLLTLEGIDPGLAYFGDLAEKLRSRRVDLHDDRLPDDAAYSEIVADLQAVEAILGDIDHGHIGREDLERALRKTRKRARKRYARMDAGGNPHAYHDFRKATKRELYQARYLGADPQPGGRLEQLDRLGECLGHNQDLIVLKQMARELGAFDDRLAALIEDERSTVRAECRRLAADLYGRDR